MLIVLFWLKHNSLINIFITKCVKRQRAASWLSVKSIFCPENLLKPAAHPWTYSSLSYQWAPSAFGEGSLGIKRVEKLKSWKAVQTLSTPPLDDEPAAASNNELLMSEDASGYYSGEPGDVVVLHWLQNSWGALWDMTWSWNWSKDTSLTSSLAVAWRCICTFAPRHHLLPPP